MSPEMWIFFASLGGAFFAALPGLYANYVRWKEKRIEKAKIDADSKKVEAEAKDIVQQIEDRVYARARDTIDRLVGENADLRQEQCELREEMERRCREQEKLDELYAKMAGELEKQGAEFAELKNRYLDIVEELSNMVDGVERLAAQIREIGEEPVYEPTDRIKQFISK